MMFAEGYILVSGPFFFLKNKGGRGDETKAAESTIIRNLCLFLYFLYGLIVLLPVTLVWFIICGFEEVKKMYDEAEKVANGGKRGFSSAIIAFQRSEDV
jgi:hypothetical protein